MFENRYSMMDMDARALIPFFGYSGPNALDDYYNDTQIAGKMNKIKVPTMFLNAWDDPCYDKRLYPFKEFENGNDNLLLAMTKAGGHCCFFTGSLIPI